jgi:hypothetical protein
MTLTHAQVFSNGSSALTTTSLSFDVHFYQYSSSLLLLTTSSNQPLLEYHMLLWQVPRAKEDTFVSHTCPCTGAEHPK